MSRHAVTLTVDDSEKHTYCGSDIKDGTLRLLFHADRLGMFPSDASNDLVQALKSAPAPAGTMNLLARNGIKADYDGGGAAKTVRADLAKALAVADLRLTPNFEANYARLAALDDAAPAGWDARLGRDTLAYFEGVLKSLRSQKFDSDEILQEGFQEAVVKKEIALAIVDVLDCGGSYNEVAVKDGVLVVQVRRNFFFFFFPSRRS